MAARFKKLRKHHWGETNDFHPPARFSRNLARARGLGFSRARSLPTHGLCFSRARSPASYPSTSTLISSGPSTKFQDPTFSEPNPSQIDVNPLRPLSSSSRQGKAGRGRGAPAAVAARSTSVNGARVTPTDGSSSAAGNPAVVAAAAYPPLPSLQATGFPAWWTSSRWAPMKGFTHQVVLSI
ncbi:hypothetical protein BDA96_06G221600 [Sorghum bicolor]|uniref:Uncharacterized protein n=2 Tax=Sorghum bicolor TaxID=4558 RepID=A0A921QT25_SORBI|nr:hypothetical protein BDA96_06G221600 [Sorghum bicolor]KXG27038.1 hypothetical protein SORBI_3006G202700 [Sorghum bicolor]